FKSTINLVYIIEEKTLHQTDKISDSFRTHYNRLETSNDIIKKSRLRVDNIILNDAKFFLKNKEIPFKEKIVEGEFSNVVKRELDENNYDLVLMGFEKGCILNYRLLDEVNVPIWIESDGESKSILAVCSNLAPNQKVPEFSVKLSEDLGWDLHMLYVVDMGDSVEVDETGQRSDRKSEKDLIFIGENFVEKMREKGINVRLVKGGLEKETVKAAEDIGANLVIVGREQKKKNIFGLPVKNVKKKIAEKCRYSILFVN
ncbi:MAG: universal stress protein, partial [Thermoplasmatales archaeon]|nr:universal stress protein [Thermoplasmatales archaeon]